MEAQSHDDDGHNPEHARDPGARRTRLIDGRPEDRHRWALAALAVPLFFCAVVALGVYLMFHRQMGVFKPAHMGRGPDGSAPLALLAAPGAGAAHSCAPARCADPASGSLASTARRGLHHFARRTWRAADGAAAAAQYYEPSDS
jgi:hypothetical protein